MSATDTPIAAEPEVIAEVRGRAGFLTLNRPKALNALSLGMVRALTGWLLAWRDDPQVLAVAVRGAGRDGPFGAFCAGGDIRFLHRAGSQGDPALEDFFTEEYALDHLIHVYPKPYVAFMDGIVMGGGMGIGQGASRRIVTERTKMAMPETAIGLFPDVGGGYFLSRTPGRVGEWLALTGETIGGADALAYGLADAVVPSADLPVLWDGLGAQDFAGAAAVEGWLAQHGDTAAGQGSAPRERIDRFFALESVPATVAALERPDAGDWAHATAAVLRKRSPLMLHVVLEQIRRARALDLAGDLRMERGLVRHCFFLRPGQSETIEGIRALVVDKDHSPRWNPARIEDVPAEAVAAFFASPWPAHAHPLRWLAGG
ncbi:enoyl-CoA hydratase/isomerase family protein [Xylophilus sp.]|uniref:enoyl-CoA hydratase/isomerase family protein n=1 Tax=Xylophilus sp. TaxID=2653893 RepID=UPI0013B69C86|nr:enoyl-CoA hydratase/isomerase family protein [Xylophilus sp.]KAF1042616.1 MAG: putative enoyl-CoA hydratase echA8 [Xylophilus sp.]